MEVKVIIEGMMCAHCSARVEKAFNSVEGIEAKVSLDEKTAFLKLDKEFSDQELINITDEAGYKAVQIIR